MAEFHKSQDPTPAHALLEKNYVTTYKTDNAYDRIALSQKTGGHIQSKDVYLFTRLCDEKESNVFISILCMFVPMWRYTDNLDVSICQLIRLNFASLTHMTKIGI